MYRLGAILVAAVAITGCTDSDGSGSDPIMVPTPEADMAPPGDVDMAVEGDMFVEPDMGEPVECEGDPDLQPPILNEHVAVWDPEREQMIVFGGNTEVPVNCGFPPYTFESTTWLYDPAAAEAGCPPWTELNGGPSGRTRAATAWGGGYMWVYGGRFRNGTSGPYQVYGDLWRFDPTDETWTEIEFEGNARPSPRFNTSLVWDSTRERLVLYAGNSNGGINPTVESDLWIFDPADRTWTEARPGGDVPPRRMWHAALYDETRDQMVIYGGGDETAFFNDARYFAELRALDMATAQWSVIHPGTPAGATPPGRFWSGLVHDPENDVYVMFAGHDDGNPGIGVSLGNRNDLWTYDPEAGTWELVLLGDEWNAPANGFCDFPADFTTIVPGTPERRNAHSVIWADDRLVTFGGKTDCGAVNDVWHWNTADGWTNPVIATEGEMCIRWRANPDNCVNMCF